MAWDRHTDVAESKLLQMKKIIQTLISCLIKKSYRHYKVLWEKSLNSDGHQFHQYQQKQKKPPLTLSH